MPSRRISLRPCQQCGEPIQAYGTQRKFCSPECALAHRRKHPQRLRKRCETCGTEFIASSENRRFCHPNCSRRAVYRLSKKPAGECRGCGVPLGDTARSDKKFCSIRCRSAYYEACRREQGQPASYRKGWNGYGRILLADPCSYCGTPAETVDHIVPRARGGEHSLNNLTAVCHSCNQKKRARSLLSFLMVEQAERMFPGWVKSASRLP